MKMNEHDKHCRAIAEELEQIANGDLVLADGQMAELLFDDNGIEYAEPYKGEFWTVDGEPITIDGKEIETDATDEEFETATMYDYFDEFYNVDYIVDSNKEHRACRIMIACGGPNIYVNTWDKCVELYWWSESGKAWLSNDVCNCIDEFMEELYCC